MGAYLDKPVTHKDTEGGTMDLGQHKDLPFVVSSMQGWRKTMEDAHIAMPNLEAHYDVPAGTSLYAVFDGHGGKEVSIFCAKYFVKTLVNLESFKARAYREALVESFHKIDELLMNPRYADELKRMMNGADSFLAKKPIDEDDDEKSKSSLYDEFGPDAETETEDIPNEPPKPLEVDEERTKKLEKCLEGLPKRAESLNLSMNKDAQEQLKREQEKMDVEEPAKESEQQKSSTLDKLEQFAEQNDDTDLSKSTGGGERSDIDTAMVKAENNGTLTKNEAMSLVLRLLGVSNNGKDENNDDDEEEDDTDKDIDDNKAAAPTHNRFVSDFDVKLPTYAGATACVALIIEGKLYVANAGDSRAVLCRDKKAEPMSFDHKPGQERERTRINKAGGWVTNMGRVCGNLNLSRCIGDLKYKQREDIDRAEQIITAEPDVKVTDITDEDLFLVVACDGVWDILTNDGIVDFVSKKLVEAARTQNTEEALAMKSTIEDVFTHCICDDPITDGKGGDNMTAILVCLRPLGEVVTSFWS